MRKKESSHDPQAKQVSTPNALAEQSNAAILKGAKQRYNFASAASLFILRLINFITQEHAIPSQYRDIYTYIEYN